MKRTLEVKILTSASSQPGAALRGIYRVAIGAEGTSGAAARAKRKPPPPQEPTDRAAVVSGLTLHYAKMCRPEQPTRPKNPKQPAPTRHQNQSQQQPVNNPKKTDQTSSNQKTAHHQDQNQRPATKTENRH